MSLQQQQRCMMYVLTILAKRCPLQNQGYLMLCDKTVNQLSIQGKHMCFSKGLQEILGKIQCKNDCFAPEMLLWETLLNTLIAQTCFIFTAEIQV